MSSIVLHPAQSEVIAHLFSPVKTPADYDMKFVTVVGSRGLGKSWMAGAAASLAVRELESLPKGIPNKNIAIIAGTFSQVAEIFIPMLIYSFRWDVLTKGNFSESTGKFVFPNGTVVRVWSAEAFRRLRGTGQYFVIADELTTWSTPSSSIQDAWESVIEPTITTRWSPLRARQLGAPHPGRALIISTPLGKDYFYELSNRGLIDSRWKNFHYTYRDSPLLDQTAIENAKKTSDPLRFAREYEASFEESGAAVFYAFKREHHVDNSLPYFEPSEVVHAAIDFNVMKMCTTFWGIRGDQAHCIDEHQSSANTEQLAAVIRERFPRNRIICYPDPTGTARKSSASVGITDFSILESAGFTVLARRSSPPLVDSVNAVNRKLMNAAGEVDMFFHPRCINTISSMERTVWLENRPDTAQIDKSAGVEHFSDGVRYITEYNWPIRRGQTSVTALRSSSF